MGEIYKGVEFKLKAYSDNVEKLFYVNKDGSPESIKIKLSGARNINVNEQGELVVKTDLGDVRFTKPIAYQEKDNKRVAVAVNYTITPDLVYGFKVGEYDRDYPLVIDPLLASTFIGGSSWEIPYALALDAAGNVFVTGETWSIDFPTTSGAYDTTRNHSDIFVSKLDSNLSTLIASTYIGGSDTFGEARAFAIAIDNSGNVIIAGETQQTQYPTTAGSYSQAKNGGIDVIVSKFDNNLVNLLASTFIGGSESEEALTLKLDSSGNIFIAGWTMSADFPVTAGSYQGSMSGGFNAYISKLDGNLTTMISSTFLHGTDDGSEATGLSVDSSGTVFVVGVTASGVFPTTAGAFDQTINGDSDLFIAKLNNNLTGLLASTFIGPSDYYDDGLGGTCQIAFDSLGNLVVGGQTSSASFPPW
jgi:hypothetical protein